MGRGMGLRIYVKYCLKIWIKKKRGLSQSCFFQLKVTILDVWGVKNGSMTKLMNLKLKITWSVEIKRRFNGFFVTKTEYSKHSIVFSFTCSTAGVSILPCFLTLYEWNTLLSLLGKWTTHIKLPNRLNFDTNCCL